MLAEKWDYHFHEIISSSHNVAVQMFPVIVVALVEQHAADTEERLQVAKTADALSALCHRELMRDLKAGSVALPVRSFRLPDETD
jgi:hypothetical protein